MAFGESRMERARVRQHEQDLPRDGWAACLASLEAAADVARISKHAHAVARTRAPSARAVLELDELRQTSFRFRRQNASWGERVNRDGWQRLEAALGTRV
jgi:hypothetical protein